MLILLPVIILIIIPAVMLGLSLFRKEFNSYWLMSLGSSFLAWVLLWVLRSRLPSEFVLMTWGIEGIVSAPIVFQIDKFSWLFAIGLSSLLMAVLLLGVIRALEAPWTNWASDLGITAMGIIAVLSGNLFTLIITWTMIDVLELYVLFDRVEDHSVRGRAGRFFVASVIGTFVALAVGISSDILVIPFDDWGIVPAGLLFLAVGLRIGILPLQTMYMQESHQQGGLRTILRLVPAAASVILLTRLTNVPIIENFKWLMLGLVGLGTIYGAVAWARAESPLAGRAYWILSMSGMSFGAGLVGKSDAAASWGIGLIFAGGFILLLNRQDVSLRPAVYLMVFNLSMLPMSPTFAGTGVYTFPFNPLMILYLLGLIGIVAGYLRHVNDQVSPLGEMENSIKAIYIIGGYFLPVTYLLAGGIFYPQRDQGFDSVFWPVGVIMLGLLLLYWLNKRGLKLSEELLRPIGYFFSLNWLILLFEKIFGILQKGLVVITGILEGQGGMLWAIMIVVMLVSLVSQIGGVGK